MATFQKWSLSCFPSIRFLQVTFHSSDTLKNLSKLYYIRPLRILDISSNNLMTIPEDLSFMVQLEEINLAANNFSSNSAIVKPTHYFQTLSTIPKLKKLNLSRNKLTGIHMEEMKHNAFQ
jgi:Leucine-rich repeat (LRR) protein